MSTEPSQALSAQISPEPKTTIPYPPDCPPNPLQPVTNQQFLENVFHTMPSGAHVAVCSKVGNPKQGPWWAKQAETSIENLMDDKNNYFSCSSFYKTESGLFSAKKENVVALHAILFDDVEGKVSRAKFINIQLSYEIETSPGNFQAGIILKEPITDMKIAERLTQALISKRFSDPNAGGVTRWARLPRAINGKDEHIRNGKPFKCRLTVWRPECRYSLEEVADILDLDLDERPEPTIPQSKPSPLPLNTYKNQVPATPQILTVMIKLLQVLGPDCGYDTWTRIGMAIFHTCGGSDVGLELYDAWSASGKKYPGRKNIETKWRSFRLDIPNPVTIGTLIHIAKEQGIDVADILEETFEPCETIVISGGAK